MAHNYSLFAFLLGLFLCSLLSSSVGAATVSSTMRKFGTIKTAFYFPNAETFIGDWTLTLLTTDYHRFIPHKADFEPGFVPESYETTDPELQYNLSSIPTSCKLPLDTNPDVILQSVKCVRSGSDKIHNLVLEGISVALLPNIDPSTQPFPRFQFVAPRSNTDITFELGDNKPWGTADFQTAIASPYVFPTPHAFINETSQQLQLSLIVNTDRKNTPDDTFSLELLGPLDTPDQPQYLFFIHNPEFKAAAIDPLPKLTTTNMTAIAFNTNSTLITMKLSPLASALNVTNGAVPSGQVFNLALPEVFVIRNPAVEFTEPITPPRLRLKSVYYQADVDYALPFVPIATTDFEEPKRSDDCNSWLPSLFIPVLVGSISAVAVIVIGLVLLKRYREHKLRQQMIAFDDPQEPLIIS